MFKRLVLIGMLLSTQLFGQIEGVFTNFFKYSTIYAGFNLSSPIYQDDRYRLSMLDEDGNENWQSGEITIQRDERDLTRNISPLKAAKDAIVLDSTKLNIESVLDKILELYKISDVRYK